MYHLIASSVFAQNLGLLGALVVDGLLRIGLVVLLLLADFLVFLATLALIDGSQTSFLTTQFGLNRLQSICSSLVGLVKYTLDERMVAVEYYHIRIRHLHIETHARLILAGLLHTAHIFILGDEYRLPILAHRLDLDHELGLVYLGHLSLEDL